MGEYVLQMKDITKRFSGNAVLKNVGFCLKPGEVHALLGENGAGKSTLMKILMGIYKLEEGQILLNGEEITITSAHQALQNGIAMIHQELNPILDLSIAENIFVGREIKKHGLIDKKRMEKEADSLIQTVGLNLPSATIMRELSVAQMQMVEIVKAISWNSKIIIMDEPTASLTEREVTILFDLIRKLVRNGVAIIFISHKLDEIFEISDRITVLRNGEYITTELTSETDKNRLISMMVGRDVNEIYPKTEALIGDVAFEVRNISVPGRVHDVSFSVRSGEILGIVGLVGAGRSEMMEAIFGLRKKTSGSMLIHGKDIDIRHPRTAVANKIAFVTEDRKVTGLNLVGNIRENVTIVSIQDLSTNGKLNRGKENEASDYYIDQMKIKTDSREKEVSTLSGGNQQKVAIAKWLVGDPDVIILDEPTRGIDVGAKRDIYLLMGELAKQGKAIIMISSEMPEVIGMSDRIMVLADGKNMGFLNRSEFDQETLMHMQFGTEIKD